MKEWKIAAWTVGLIVVAVVIGGLVMQAMRVSECEDRCKREFTRCSEQSKNMLPRAIFGDNELGATMCASQHNSCRAGCR